MAERIVARPTPEKMKEILRYDPETGKFYWETRPASMFPKEMYCKVWNSRFSGKECFTSKNENGYMYATVFYAKIRAHQAAWAISYGYWPEADVDHINGIRCDNRLKNLRAASRSQNNCNSGLRIDNTSGYRGVSLNARTGKWVAQILIDKKHYALGYFDSPEAAHAAYQAKAIQLHGEFRRSA